MNQEDTLYLASEIQKKLHVGNRNLSLCTLFTQTMSKASNSFTREYKNHTTQMNKSISFMVIEHTNRIQASPFIFGKSILKTYDCSTVQHQAAKHTAKYHRYIYYTTAFTCTYALYIQSVLYNIHIIFHAFHV